MERITNWFELSCAKELETEDFSEVHENYDYEQATDVYKVVTYKGKRYRIKNDPSVHVTTIEDYSYDWDGMDKWRDIKWDRQV